MLLDDLKLKADKDLKIDVESLDKKSTSLPYITGSWLKELNKEIILLRSFMAEHSSLRGKKFHYYKNDFNVLIKSASDVNEYINADEDFKKSLLKMQYQEEKVKYVESVIGELNRMSFNISNAIKWNMFKSGGM